MGKFKGAIFDLDGTLTNSLADLTTSLNLMLNSYSFPEITENDTLKKINNGSFLLVKRTLPEDGKNFSDDFVRNAIKVYEKYYDIHYLDKTQPYGNLKEEINILKQNGFKLAVCSNKQDKYTQKIIKTLFGENTFDVILGHDEKYGLSHKPDPAPCRYILKKFGLNESETAYIGDSDIDMRTGKNTGMTTFGVAWGYRSVELLKETGADEIIYKTNDLSKILLNY